MAAVGVVSHPIFPTEVFERIIDFCWGRKPWRYDDHATLVACTLTCRTWYPRSRNLLYRDITLSTAETLYRLVEVLRTRPSNGSFILSLRIHPQPGSKQKHSWISLVPLLLSPMVNNLRSLNIMHTPLSMVHGTFLMAISQFKTVTSLTLAYVTVPSFDFFSRLVLAFPLLDHLDIATVPVSQHDPEILHKVVPNPRAHRLHLSELVVTSDGSAVLDISKWLLLTPSITSLRRLVFKTVARNANVSRAAERSIAMLLRACGPSVQELEFTLNAEWMRNKGISRLYLIYT